MKDYIKEEKTFKIKNYCKNNTVSLIAVITAIVTAMSMVLKLLVILIEKNKMNYWHIDYNLNISISSGDQLYYVGMSVVITAVMSLLYYGLRSVIKTFLNCLYYNKCIIMIKAFTNIYEKCNDFSFDDYSEDGLSTKMVHESFDRLEKESNEIRKDQLKALIVFFIIFTLLIISLYLIFQMINGELRKSYVISNFVTAVLLTIIAFVFEYNNKKNRKYRQTKKKMPPIIIEKTDYSENEITQMVLCSANLSMIAVDYSKEIESMFQKMLLDDDLIKNLISFVFAAFVCSFLSISIMSFSNEDSRNSFYLYENQGKQYALVYNNDKYMIFEEAIIDKSKISINCNSQLIMENNDNIYLERTEFKEVIK